MKLQRPSPVILVANVLPSIAGDGKKKRVKVKFVLEQALKSQRWSRGIALLFL
jgi:hypothetical protein